MIFSTVEHFNFWSSNPLIRIDLKCWIQIRMETNADPHHPQHYFFKFIVKGRRSRMLFSRFKYQWILNYFAAWKMSVCYAPFPSRFWSFRIFVQPYCLQELGPWIVREDEPEIDENFMCLDWYNSDLNLRSGSLFYLRSGILWSFMNDKTYKRTSLLILELPPHWLTVLRNGFKKFFI